MIPSEEGGGSSGGAILAPPSQALVSSNPRAPKPRRASAERRRAGSPSIEQVEVVTKREEVGVTLPRTHCSDSPDERSLESAQPKRARAVHLERWACRMSTEEYERSH